MPITALAVGQTVNLLDAVTTGTGVGKVVPINSKNLKINTRGTGIISSGTIIIEEAATYDYSGTWSTLYTVTASELTGGAAKTLHFFGTFQAIRARIGTNIGGGGNVTVEAVCD